MGDQETPDGLGPNDTSSGLFLCGPVHSEEVIARNQLLRVRRYFTDAFGLIILSLFVAFMAVVWFFAAENAQFDHLMHGMDWRGKACGTGDLHEAKYQAWTNPLLSDIGLGAICTTACPMSGDGAKEIDRKGKGPGIEGTLVCLCNKKKWPEKFGDGAYRSEELQKHCKQPKAMIMGYFEHYANAGDAMLSNAKTGTSGGVDQPCSFKYRTTWSMGKCAPWISEATMEKIVNQETATNVTTDHVSIFLKTGDQVLSTMMTDALNCGNIIVTCVAYALALSLVALLLLEYVSEPFIHAIVFVLEGCFIAGTIGCWFNYAHYRDLVHSNPQPATYSEDQTSEWVYFGIFIIGCVASVIYACLATYMYSNEKLDTAESMLLVASESFKLAPSLLAYPIVHSLLWIILLAAWLGGAVLIYSAGEVHVGSDGVAHMQHISWLRQSFIPYFFGLIWLAGFMNAMGYMIVAGTIFMSSFANKHPLTREWVVPGEALTSSVAITVRWHMGSAALGSLILVCLFIPRIIVGFFAKMSNWGGVESADEQEKKPSSFLQTCLYPCTACFQNQIRYLNKMAFLQTIFHGFSFYDAAHTGLLSVFENFEYIGPTSYVSTFVIVVIKISIAIGVTFLGNVMIMSGQFGINFDDLTYSWFPCLLIFFTSYILCTAFMITLEVGIDALLAGWCEAHHNSGWEGVNYAGRKEGELFGGVTEDQLRDPLKDHMFKEVQKIFPDPMGDDEEAQPFVK